MKQFHKGQTYDFLKKCKFFENYEASHKHQSLSLKPFSLSKTKKRAATQKIPWHDVINLAMRLVLLIQDSK